MDTFHGYLPEWLPGCRAVPHPPVGLPLDTDVTQTGSGKQGALSG